jgi:hypothetical protein
MLVVEVVEHTIHQALLLMQVLVVLVVVVMDRVGQVLVVQAQ